MLDGEITHIFQFDVDISSDQTKLIHPTTMSHTAIYISMIEFDVFSDYLLKEMIIYCVLAKLNLTK
jgi:hypothetical protein